MFVLTELIVDSIELSISSDDFDRFGERFEISEIGLNSFVLEVFEFLDGLGFFVSPSPFETFAVWAKTDEFGMKLDEFELDWSFLGET